MMRLSAQLVLWLVLNILHCGPRGSVYVLALAEHQCLRHLCWFRLSVIAEAAVVPSSGLVLSERSCR